MYDDDDAAHPGFVPPPTPRAFPSRSPVRFFHRLGRVRVALIIPLPPLSRPRRWGAQTSVSSDIVRAHLRPRTLASFAATFPPSASCLSPLPSPPRRARVPPERRPGFGESARDTRGSPRAHPPSHPRPVHALASANHQRARRRTSAMGTRPVGGVGARAPSSSNETPRRPQSAPRRTRRRRRRRNRTRAHAPHRRRGRQRRVARLWSLESATASPPDRPLSARRRPRRRPLRRPRRRPPKTKTSPSPSFFHLGRSGGPHPRAAPSPRPSASESDGSSAGSKRLGPKPRCRLQPRSAREGDAGGDGGGGGREAALSAAATAGAETFGRGWRGVVTRDAAADEFEARRRGDPTRTAYQTARDEDRRSRATEAKRPVRRRGGRGGAQKCVRAEVILRQLLASVAARGRGDRSGDEAHARSGDDASRAQNDASLAQNVFSHPSRVDVPGARRVLYRLSQVVGRQRGRRGEEESLLLRALRALDAAAEADQDGNRTDDAQIRYRLLCSLHASPDGRRPMRLEDPRHRRRRDEDAERFATAALDVAERAFGPWHPHVADALYRWATCLNLGEALLAEPVYGGLRAA